MRAGGAFGVSGDVKSSAAPWPIIADALGSKSALVGALLLVVSTRAAAIAVLDAPLRSDALSYFLMAKALSEGATMVDAYGQIAFFSPGYPLLLAPFFALLGPSVALAQAINLGLAAISGLLVHAVARTLGAPRWAATLAVLAFAVLLTSVSVSVSLGKENLTTPLLLAYVLLTLRLARGSGPALAAAAGAIFGALLLAGPSAILTLGAMGVALWSVARRKRWPAALIVGACFAAGCLVPLAPWLAHTDRHLGAPVLTTNGAFNLYLGNNPAADGRFVGIEQTPMGARWEELRATRGELGASEYLGARARAYMLANPGRTAGLAATKLVYFWLPNTPDAADRARDPMLSALRWLEVAQYLLVMLTGVLGLVLLIRRRRIEGMLLAATLSGFWLVHALTYVIPRYREPIMPLMLICAVMALCLFRGPKTDAPGA